MTETRSLGAVAALLWLLLGLCFPAGAQERAPGAVGSPVPKDVEQLGAFLAEPFYQELVLSQWQRQSLELCGEAPGPVPLRHSGLSVYEPASFNSGRPARGVWLDRYRGHSCGRERQFNFLFTADGGRLAVAHTLPGRTEAPPRLQLDTMRAVLPKLMVRHPQCQNMIPVDSELERAPEHLHDAWSEIWVFDACGKLAAVRIRFTPDAQGGTRFQVE